MVGIKVGYCKETIHVLTAYISTKQGFVNLTPAKGLKITNYGKQHFYTKDWPIGTILTNQYGTLSHFYFLTCKCNEQVIEVNRFGTHSVSRSFPVHLLT